MVVTPSCFETDMLSDHLGISSVGSVCGSDRQGGGGPEYQGVDQYGYGYRSRYVLSPVSSKRSRPELTYGSDGDADLSVVDSVVKMMHAQKDDPSSCVTFVSFIWFHIQPTL